MRGHDDSITCVATSPSGRLVASGQKGENADAIVWDYDSRTLKYRLSEHDHSVAALAFSHDELLLCTIGGRDDGKLIVWDLANGYIVTVVSAQPSGSTCVAWGGFCKDIKRRNTSDYQFCTAGGTKAVLWKLDPISGELTSERVTTDGRGCTVREMTWIVFDPADYETIYGGTTSGDFVPTPSGTLGERRSPFGLRFLRRWDAGAAVVRTSVERARTQVRINVRKKSVSGRTVFASPGGVEALLVTGEGGLITGGGDGTCTLFDAKMEDRAQARLPGPRNYAVFFESAACS